MEKIFTTLFVHYVILYAAMRALCKFAPTLKVGENLEGTVRLSRLLSLVFSSPLTNLNIIWNRYSDLL